MVIHKETENSASEAARILANGKLVVLPTDTIYGFSTIIPEGAPLIIKAKGRDEGKPFITLIADPGDISQYTHVSIPSSLLNLWPGSLTLVVPTEEGTRAFRCPGDEWLRTVIRLLGRPIYSTSVNKAGEQPINRISEILTVFGTVATLIVDAGDITNTSASTIVDLCGDTIRILRQGSLKIPTEVVALPLIP